MREYPDGIVSSFSRTLMLSPPLLVVESTETMSSSATTSGNTEMITFAEEHVGSPTIQVSYWQTTFPTKRGLTGGVKQSTWYL